MITSKKSYEVTVIESDFHHGKKEKKDITRDDFLFIDTLPYKRNLSDRLKSHDDFLKYTTTRWICTRISFTLMFPPNSLMKCTSAYKAKNPQGEIDSGHYRSLAGKHAGAGKPEEAVCLQDVEPISGTNIWRKLILVLTECHYYYDVLKKYIGQTETGTLYLAQDSIPYAREKPVQLSQESFDICYLGSINLISLISTSFPSWFKKMSDL